MAFTAEPMTPFFIAGRFSFDLESFSDPIILQLIFHFSKGVSDN
jgi:hypothetical protein